MGSKAREAACTNTRAAFRCAGVIKLARIVWLPRDAKKAGSPKQTRLRRRSYGRRETSGANRINTAPSLLPRALRGGLAISAPHGCTRARILPCMSSRASRRPCAGRHSWPVDLLLGICKKDNIPIKEVSRPILENILGQAQALPETEKAADRSAALLFIP